MTYVELYRYKRRKPHQRHPGPDWEQITTQHVPGHLLHMWRTAPGEINPRTLDEMRYFRKPTVLRTGTDDITEDMLASGRLEFERWFTLDDNSQCLVEMPTRQMVDLLLASAFTAMAKSRPTSTDNQRQADIDNDALVAWVSKTLAQWERSGEQPTACSRRIVAFVLTAGRTHETFVESVGGE